MYQKNFILLISSILLIASNTPISADDKFSVGLILPLSGPAADYGQSIENCINLAKSDFPKLFDHIEFIFEDAAYEPIQAISAFQKLTQIDKVDLAYTWGVSFCKALAPLAESKRIPLIGQCIDRSSSSGKEYIIRFMNHTDEYLKVQVDYLEKKNFKNIAIILTDHPYLEEMLEALKRNLGKDQMITIVDRYQKSEQNFRSTVSKLKRNNYDIIGVFLYPGQISQFYLQAAEQKLELPTFGTNLFESVSELQLARGSMNASVFTNNIIKPAFQKRYQRIFNNTSQLGFGALSYEFALTIGKLFNKQAHITDAKNILDIISNLKAQEGVAAGPYWYRNSQREGKDFYFPIRLKKVQGETFRVISPD